MSDELDKIWEWIIDQDLDSLKSRQTAFELITKYFKDIDSNKIRQFLLQRGFFDKE